MANPRDSHFKSTTNITVRNEKPTCDWRLDEARAPLEERVPSISAGVLRDPCGLRHVGGRVEARALVDVGGAVGLVEGRGEGGGGGAAGTELLGVEDLVALRVEVGVGLGIGKKQHVGLRV